MQLTTDCPNANLELRLLALNLHDHLRVTLSRLGATAVLATVTLNRYDEKTVVIGGRLRIF